MEKILIFLFLFFGWISASYAATETIEVYFLPLNEAADVVKTQLSNEGSVVEINSSRVLLIHDKVVNITKAKALLKSLDKPVAQFTVQVKIEDISSLQDSSITGAFSVSPLSGGWAQLAIGQKLEHGSNRSQYQLRVSANKPGRIETGSMHTFNKVTQRWLSGYGLIEENSVEYISVNTGFYVQARAAGKGMVHVRITPWMKRAGNDGANDNQGVLIGLGANVTPAVPDSYLRYNEHAKPKQNHEVRIMGASTELTVVIGKEVVIAAVDHEAEKLANMLLAQRSKIGKRQFVMALKVSN